MNKIIFTDLDGTLTFRDTYIKFIFKNLTFSSALANTPALTLMTLKYIFGVINKETVKRTTFKMFFDGYDVRQNIENFAKSVKWNKKVLDMIDEKKREGYKVIMVTASPDMYLPHLCDYLGYDGFLSTKTLKNGEFLTGLFDGKVCNFEEKTLRIKEFLRDKKTSHTVSFGNSIGDYPMLEFCDEAYFVHKLNVKKFEA